MTEMELSSKEINNQGVELFLRGALRAAREKYEQALKVDPGNASALNNLGYVHAVEHDHATALDCYRRALDINPRDAIALVNMGSSLVLSGRETEGLEYFQRAAESDHVSASPWQCMARLFQLRGQPAEAEIAWSEALRRTPGDSESLYNLGVVLGMQKKTPRPPRKCFRRC